MSACESSVHLHDSLVSVSNVPLSRVDLIAPTLITTTVAEFPRLGWSDHFGRVIEKELDLKPWCHSTTFEIPGWTPGTPSHFAADVRGNDVMRPFE
jgi:cyanamide hydratase